MPLEELRLNLFWHCFHQGPGRLGYIHFNENRIFSFTLGITLCAITQILKARTRAMLVYYINDVNLRIVLFPKKLSHLMPLCPWLSLSSVNNLSQSCH